MATLKILQTSTLNLFFLVFLRYSSVSCITGYTNIYAKKNYYTQSSLDSKKESFESDSYTLAVFRDLSKAFDTVDHSIFLKKLEMYGVNTTNLAWLTDRVLIKVFVTTKGFMIKPNGFLRVPHLVFHQNSRLNDVTLNCNFL